MQKQKVLHVITNLSTGGAEMMLYKLLSTTDRTRFEPVVISMMERARFGDPIEALGIPVYEMGMKQGRPTPGTILRLVKKIREIEPDVIQGWMYHANLGAQIAGMFLGRKRPILWNIRHSPGRLEHVKRSTAAVIKLTAMMSLRPSRIIYNSRTSAGQHEALGYQEEKRVVIPNGFDLDTFKPSADARREVRAELNLPENAPLIGLIARYHPMKDHATFVRAAGVLHRTHPDAHFLVIGRGCDESNETLAAIRKEVGAEANVHLLGERKDTPRLMAALDVNTNCSYTGEGFPNVIGESMACGVPCVVTDVGDSVWIVGDTGLVVESQNPDALAAGWAQMLDMEPAARQALGEKARSRCEAHFSLSAIVEQYERLYDTFRAEGDSQ